MKKEHCAPVNSSADFRRDPSDEVAVDASIGALSSVDVLSVCKIPPDVSGVNGMQRNSM